MSGSVGDGRVVVGVDGSAGSLAALRFAFDEAARRGTDLLVVAAFESPDLWSASYQVPVSSSLDDVQEQVLASTRRTVAGALGERLAAERVPRIEVTTRPGSPADVLVSASAGSPLLVVGSRGLGGFRRVLLGSVSMQCVQHARCPVTVVRSQGEQDSPQTPGPAADPASVR